MRLNFLLAALAAIVLTSCSTRYKTGQTPDDVYFVPSAKVDEAVAADGDKDEDRYIDNTSSQEDRYLRMKVRNRYRWSTIDDWGYWNDTRYYGSYYHPIHGSFVTWNGLYVYDPVFSVGYSNHCCCYSNSPYNPYYIGPIKTPVKTVRPNLGTYSNTRYNNNNQSFIKKLGNTVSRAVDGSSSSGGRTYSPSTSGSSGGVSRPTRH